jgi:threonine/homoserine/homoserine lactone efflux protein
MLAQAAGFALLAAISPTALLVMAVFLGSANPRRTALLYVAGAAIMTIVMAITVLLVLRAVGLNQPRQHAPRYGLRFGLGLVALAVAVFMSRRKPREPAASGGKEKKPGFITRLTMDPRPRTAFLVGLLLFAPSASFIAAVQVVATANEGIPLTAAALVVIVVLTVLTVWLPLLTYLAAPDVTTRTLRSGNEWLRTHGRRLAILALWAAGVWLTVNGALGLWQ